MKEDTFAQVSHEYLIEQLRRSDTVKQQIRKN